MHKYKIDQELNQSHRPRNNSMADLPGRYQAFNSEVNRLKEVSGFCTDNIPTGKKHTHPQKATRKSTGFPLLIFNSYIVSLIVY